MTRQFLKFVFAGGFAALVNFLSRLYYSKFFSFGIAVVVAYVTGMITAFILSKLFVFKKSRHRAMKEFYLFTLVNLIAILQTWIVSVGLAGYIFPHFNYNFHREESAHFIGIGVPVISSYFGHKHLSFRSMENED